MDKEAILKNTASYEECLIKHLQDIELSRLYLETAIESYRQDGDTKALLLSLRHTIEAQCGIDELAKRTEISREYLCDILSDRHDLRLRDWLKIISGLGFRICLERKEKSAEHALAHKG